MRELVTYLLFTSIPIATAQASAQGQPHSESQLPPQAAYDQAIRPLDVYKRQGAGRWAAVHRAEHG